MVPDESVALRLVLAVKCGDFEGMRVAHRRKLAYVLVFYERQLRREGLESVWLKSVWSESVWSDLFVGHSV